MIKRGHIKTTFDQLRRDQNWETIPNCPGRFRLATGPSEMAPVALTGEETVVREYDLPVCRDVVLIAKLKDGGLISYRRPNGTYLHTLNTPEGFARKLKQLGICQVGDAMDPALGSRA